MVARCFTLLVPCAATFAGVAAQADSHGWEQQNTLRVRRRHAVARLELDGDESRGVQAGILELTPPLVQPLYRAGRKRQL